MLNSRTLLRLFAASCFAFLGCGDVVAGDEPIAYDFHGYRARVSGTIDDPRNWNPHQTPVRVSAHRLLAGPATVLSLRSCGI